MAVSDPIRELARRIKAATRAGLEETFWYWLRNIAPEHFDREALSRYSEYTESRKCDRAEWLRRHSREVSKASGYLKLDEVRPLKTTGRLRQAFLKGPVTFSRNNTILTVTWRGLPRYATYTNRYSGFQPHKAITATTETERANLVQLFRDWLNRNLLTGVFSAKSAGGAGTGD